MAKRPLVSLVVLLCFLFANTFAVALAAGVVGLTHGVCGLDKTISYGFGGIFSLLGVPIGLTAFDTFMSIVAAACGFGKRRHSTDSSK